MSKILRGIRWSAWLGWKIQSNWTDPWLFALYVVIKPLMGSLLLVCMYWAAASVTSVAPAYLSFLYVSNACYLLVGAVTFGMAWAVISDREHYGMLKYVYISPVRLWSYLVGRGLAGSVQALLGALITLVLGLVLFPELRQALDPTAIAWGPLLLYLVLGIGMLLALGLLLAGAVLHTARHGMFLSEGVAGILYLLSGTVFPIQLLPAWVQPFSRLLPTTYWLEGMRQSLLGPQQPLALPGLGSGELVAWLGGTTLGLGLLAGQFFHWSERRAWRLGKLDQTSGF